MKRISLYSLLFTTLLAGMLSACSKEEVEPSSESVIIMYFKGEINSQPFLFATNSGYVADTWMDPMDTVVRSYSFTFLDTSLKNDFEVANLTFRSGTLASQLSLVQDIDSTFQPRTFQLTQMFGNPTNPFQLATFSCEIFNKGGDTYSTYSFNMMNTGEAVIDSVKDITWVDQQQYKLVYLSLETDLMLNDSLATIPLTGGKALIAFPKGE